MKNKYLLKACASNAERKVWELLEELPDEYHVFAGVLGKDSECDFIITSPNKGILVLEVKDGYIQSQRINGIDYITSQGRFGEVKIKNPFKQSSEQSYELKRRILELPEVKKSNQWVAITYGVCLPDNDL